MHDVWYIRHKFRPENQKSLREAETERLFASVSPEENSAAVFIRNTPLNMAIGNIKNVSISESLNFPMRSPCCDNACMAISPYLHEQKCPKCFLY